MTDLDAAIRTLVENEQRQDVNPLERARGYKRLTDAPFNLSQEEVAKRMGTDQSVVSRTLALLDEPPEIQEIMSRGIISPGHVSALHTIESESERTALAQQAASKHWSVEETEKRARRAATGGRSRTSELVPERSSPWEVLRHVNDVLRMVTMLQRLVKQLVEWVTGLMSGRLGRTLRSAGRRSELPDRKPAEPSDSDSKAA